MSSLRQITFNEIPDLVQAGQQVLCIDVRDDYRQKTLDAGGWKIPYNRIVEHTRELEPYVHAVVVVCCLRPTGSKRTEIAARALRQLGFSDIRELKNGLYAGWVLKVGARVKLPAPART